MNLKTKTHIALVLIEIVEQLSLFIILYHINMLALLLIKLPHQTVMCFNGKLTFDSRS